ncbi:MAG: hypothetical protein RSB67_03505 [Clostridia bacterium]
MKITDFALVFMAVTLPIIIIVYVNVSFTIKAEEQEMYYNKIISAAVSDATSQMKQVENEDVEIDYGYSGTMNNKISVNAQVAVDTFFNSLYNNFDIQGNETAQEYLKIFIPAIGIIDYNGIQISSFETFEETKGESKQSVTKHVLKPKRYYTYAYGIDGNGNIVSGLQELKDNITSVHIIEFTMDDYVTHRGKYLDKGNKKDIPVKSFYLSDKNNNTDLTKGSTNNGEIVQVLQNIRKDIIVNAVTKELSYAVNAGNYYARSAGVSYNFTFPSTTQEEMYNTIENVGMVAFVQGISVGNKYLNSKAYSVAGLGLSTRYYFSSPIIGSSKYESLNLYHNDLNCPEYRVSNHFDITPAYVLTKQQAASAIAVQKFEKTNRKLEGFYPCPICNP